MPLTDVQIANLTRDSDDLALIVNGPSSGEGSIVTTRLGLPVPTLAYVGANMAKGDPGPDSALAYVSHTSNYQPAGSAKPQFISITTPGEFRFPMHPVSTDVVYVSNASSGTQAIEPDTSTTPPQTVNGSSTPMTMPVTTDVWMYIFDGVSNWQRVAIIPSTVIATPKDYSINSQPITTPVNASDLQGGAGYRPMLIRVTTTGCYINFGPSVNGSIIYVRNESTGTCPIFLQSGTVTDDPAYAPFQITIPAAVAGTPLKTFMYVYDLPNTNWRLVGVLQNIPPYDYSSFDMVLTTSANLIDIYTPAPHRIPFIRTNAGTNDYMNLQAGVFDGAVFYIRNESTTNTFRMQTVGGATTDDPAMGTADNFAIPVALAGKVPPTRMYRWNLATLTWKFVGLITETAFTTQANGSLATPAFATPEFANRLTAADASKNGLSSACFKVPYSDRNMEAYGDSITAGTGASTQAKCWANLTAANIGVASFTNYGVGSDLSMDTVNHVLNYANANIAAKKVYSLAVGVNDLTKAVSPVQLLLSNARQAMFNSCIKAAVYWLAIPSENKLQGNSSLGSNWSADTTFAAVTGAKSTTNGASNMYSVTTTGGPILLWTRIMDGNGGVANVTIDGGAAIPVSFAPPETIATFNGATSTVQLIYIDNIAPGTHSVVVTVTSATSSSNVVTICAVGTTPSHAYYTAPTVVVLGILPQVNNSFGAGDSVLTSAIIDQAAAAQNDGLDVRICDNHKTLKNGIDPSVYADGQLHPNDYGYSLIAPAVETVFRTPPAKSVSRATPPAGSKGTPGDAWANNGQIFGVMADQSIHYVTATGTV